MATTYIESMPEKEVHATCAHDIQNNHWDAKQNNNSALQHDGWPSVLAEHVLAHEPREKQARPQRLLAKCRRVRRSSCKLPVHDPFPILVGRLAPLRVQTPRLGGSAGLDTVGTYPRCSRVPVASSVALSTRLP